MSASDPLGPVDVTVRPLDAPMQSANRGDGKTYAAILFSIGYEIRSTFVAETYLSRAATAIGFTFEKQRVGSYDKNVEWARSVGAAVIDEADAVFRKSVLQQVHLLNAAWRQAELVRNGSGENPRPLRILVDLSSMTRQRIADVLLALYVDAQFAIDADWVYAPATYPGSTLANGVVRVNNPVEGFEGWGDPDDSLTCILGAGPEGDLSIGVIDELEPSDTWVLQPIGYSPKHDGLVLRQNSRIAGTLEEGQLLQYRVDQPFETLLTLHALVDDLTARGRVVLIPLGPKLFAFQCLLVGLTDRRNITVWRVSADFDRRASERRPNGDLFGLRVISSSK